MKVQLFASSALTLLSTFPGVLSVKVSPFFLTLALTVDCGVATATLAPLASLSLALGSASASRHIHPWSRIPCFLYMPTRSSSPFSLSMPFFSL